jgi:aryl-alcohol dehydrogenase-like predicted oxidoreductase
MEYRRLGNSGLRVPALSFGTATFGGGNDFFRAWGSTDAAGASRLIDICLDHGLSMFDSADTYSGGLAETILGAAIRGNATGCSFRRKPLSRRERGRMISVRHASICWKQSRDR